MNPDALQRGRVLTFAYEQARHTGSLPCIKAVCYVLRNRRKAGWGDGTWLSLIYGHRKVAGTIIDTPPELDLKDRILQMLMRDIDDIYVGNSAYEGEEAQTTAAVVDDALYYQFIDLPTTEWFAEKIVRNPKQHPRCGIIGTMAFFK